VQLSLEKPNYLYGLIVKNEQII